MKIKLDEISVDYAKNKSRQSRITLQSIESLADSIASHGQDTPVKVRPMDGPKPYELFVGYRRFTAVQSLGRDEIDATICDVTDEQAGLENLRENLERADISFWEQACCLRDIFPPETSIFAIAAAINRSRVWVRPRWLLWTLPDEIISRVEIGEFHIGDVMMIVHADEPERIAQAEAIRLAKATGELPKPSNKPRPRTVDELLRMSCIMLEKEREPEMRALVWAAGRCNADELRL